MSDWNSRWDRQGLLVRLGALAIAVVIALLVLEAWGITGGIMKVYFNTPTVAPRPPITPGEVSVKVLPPPKTEPKADADKTEAPPPK